MRTRMNKRCDVCEEIINEEYYLHMSFICNAVDVMEKSSAVSGVKFWGGINYNFNYYHPLAKISKKLPLI
jgi:hypothetical protein